MIASRIAEGRRIARSTRMFMGVGTQCSTKINLAVRTTNAAINVSIASLAGIATDVRIKKRLATMRRELIVIILRIADFSSRSCAVPIASNPFAGGNSQLVTCKNISPALMAQQYELHLSQ